MKNFVTFLLLSVGVTAQVKTQTISGKIFDKQTKQALPGAAVVLAGSVQKTGTTSDAEGFYVLKNVPVGRVVLKATYLGYEPYISDALVVTSTKQVTADIGLTTGSTTTEEVTITANKNAFEPLNNMSVLSTRSFTVEETERMPAGVNDPGRVALSFPGVQRGPDDSENQIVVRGNSPIGILWRLEGIDIPNPNHFAVVGSSGGGVTVFSAQLLGKSDFSTGGFAAEYGNALSGAFDMNFRHGNFTQREYRARVGVLGLDFATEGPIKSGRSSYLINYRYSTLGLLSRMGFYLVGERVVNDFQDLSFNIVKKAKNGKSISTLFGIGGLSLENYLPVSDPAKRKIGVANHWENRYKPSNVGAVGYTHTYMPNGRSYLKTVVAAMASQQIRNSDTLNLEDQRFRYNTENYLDRRLALSSTYSYKMSDKDLVKTGIIFNQIFFDFAKETLPRTSTSDISQIQRKVSVNGEGNTQTFQWFGQVQHSLGSKVKVNLGVHFLSLLANKTTSLEPRFSVLYQPTANQKVSLAAGKYGRILPLMTYYFTDSTGTQVNKNLDMLKAQHYILAYQLFTKNRMRLSLEAYSQIMNNVPIDKTGKTNYWMLNYSYDFPEFPLASSGKGYNKGIDAALEKQFSNQYFFLVTGSMLNSQYQLASKERYQSRFNTRFSSSYTFGKEFSLKSGNLLQIGGRYLLNGGFRYTPYDPVASAAAQKFVALANSEFAEQTPAYKRLDARIAYRFNGRKLSGNVGLDIQNVFNRLNPTGIGYNATANTTYYLYNGSGLIPVLSSQFDF